MIGMLQEGGFGTGAQLTALAVALGFLAWMMRRSDHRDLILQKASEGRDKLLTIAIDQLKVAVSAFTSIEKQNQADHAQIVGDQAKMMTTLDRVDRHTDPDRQRAGG